MKDDQSDYGKEVERLVSFLHKSYKARVKWSRTGKWEQAIRCEIGIALAMGRLDLVSNLMQRLSRLQFLAQKAEAADYEERFSDVGTLPEEAKEEDSTQSSLESEKGFATEPKQ